MRGVPVILGMSVLGMFVMIGCGERPAGAPAGGLLSDSSGIAVWSIPQGERKAPLQVERVRGLALPDTGWTIWIDDVAADPVAEVIYILDQDTPRLLAFRFDGSFVGQIGRRGEGPGEYAAPNAITVEPNGDLLVVDPGTGSLRRWSRSGSYLGSEPLSPPYWGPGFAALDDGLVYTTASGEKTGTMVEALVLLGPGGVDTLSTVESYWKPLEMPCGRMPVPEVFSLSSVWGTGAGRVAWAAVPRYELTVWASGGPETIYRWDFPPRTVTREEAEASVEEGPLSFLVEGCGMTDAGLVREAGWVEEISPIFMLSIDPEGRVWAARGTGPIAEAIDVFDPRDGYLGTLQTSAFPLLFLGGGRYLTLQVSDWSTTVELWRVAKE